MSISLGAAPIDMTVRLTGGADFLATIRNSDGNFPAGATVELAFDVDPAVTWSAAVSGTDAVFVEQSEAVDALIAAKPRHARLWYRLAGLDACWAKGPVIRD